MEIVITGSAGSLPIPRFGCSCNTCKKEQDGKEHSVGASLVVKDKAGNFLFDTPAGIGNALSRNGIGSIKTIVYTHWHPDHVEGFRFVEDACHSYLEGRRLEICAPYEVLEDLHTHFPTFNYMLKRGWAVEKNIEDFFSAEGGTKITPIRIDTDEANVYSYLIKQEGKTILYAPCDVRSRKSVFSGLPQVDVLFLESPFPITSELRKRLPGSHPWQNHLSVEEAEEIVRIVNPGKVFFTHIDGARHESEGVFGEGKIGLFKNSEFAYDGMVLKI